MQRCEVRGKYPFYAEKMWQGKRSSLEIYPGDLETLEQGTVDFMSFSYYMSICVGQQGEKDSVSGNLTGGLKNPYLETSDWGWQIDPMGLRVTR